MLSCARAAALASEKRDRPLSRRERLSLRFHNMLCRMCRAYERNLEMISRISEAAGDAVMKRKTVNLSPAAKERIRKMMSDQ